MEKITFTNNQAPALNDYTLNQLQDNIENAIDNVENVAEEKVDKNNPIVSGQIKNKNLFNRNQIINGHYISSSGVIEDDETSCYTFPIFVESGDYTLSGNFVATSPNWYIRIHGYNYLGTWVKQIKAVQITSTPTTEINFTINANDNINYIRISMSSISGDVSLFTQLEKGTTSSTFSPTSSYVLCESGYNSNGYWYKYSDGTMICTQYKSLTGNECKMTTAYGNVYYSDITTNWTFPVAFSSAPIINATTYFKSGAGGGFSFSSSPSSTGCAGYPYYARSFSFGDNNVGVYFTAIGRWI